MGLFDKLKKIIAPKPIVDEKKAEEVAGYQSKDHPLIRDLQVKPLIKNFRYIEGKVYCKLWDTDILVQVFDDVPLDYAEKCAEAMNAMPENLIDAICRAAKKYCIEYLDDIGGASENGIELTVPVDENTPPLEMLKCFEASSLSVDIPKEPSRIGYQLVGCCDWEEEHGIEIVILDDKLVYLGEFEGASPWKDYSEDNWNAAAHIYE